MMKNGQEPSLGVEKDADMPEPNPNLQRDRDRSCVESRNCRNAVSSNEDAGSGAELTKAIHFRSRVCRVICNI
jgi:hypothetical protein